MDDETKSVRVETEYFERPEGSLPILILIQGLAGICSSLDEEAGNLSFNDHEQIERLGGLGIAANILVSQLYRRFTAKPLSKRQLEKGRKERQKWLASHDAMRERLAGPAKQLLRAAYAGEQTEGSA